VTSTDGVLPITFLLPHEMPGAHRHRIVNEGRGINCVVYEISSKTHGSIESRVVTMSYFAS